MTTLALTEVQTKESTLFVGNMANARTSWIVISVLNGLVEQPSLFDLSA